MPPEKPDRLYEVFRRLFHPIARVLIARGVTITAAIEVMKGAMVDVVERDARHQTHLTDSRVSLLTGLHRKDVRRLRRDETPPAKRSFESGCALIVAYWTADRRFLDSKGKPKLLASSPTGKGTSFQDLMRATGLDLPAATVLEELENTAVVAIDQGRAKVRLLKPAYLPDDSDPAKLEAFEKNLDAHLSAAAANLLTEDKKAPFFERAAHFNNLSAAAIKQLDKRARKLKQSLLETLNREALAHQKRDSQDPKNRHRISFGAYLYTRLPDAELPEKPEKKLPKDGDQ